MKKLFLGLILLCFATIGFAESITGYYVNPQVNLDRPVTIAGTYNNDVNSGILCKFVVFEQDGNVLERLTDEYTFSDGTFYSEKTVQENLYHRGQDYNVTTTCGTATVTAMFSVINKQPITDNIAYDLLWYRDNASSIAFLLAAIFLGIVLFATISANT